MGHNQDRKVVLITGASAGIGAAIAKVYAKKGSNLVLLARRTDKLEKISSECKSLTNQTGIMSVQCDVTSIDQLNSAVSKATKEFGQINIVIANAGFVVRGKLDELTVEDYRRQFETNFFGVLNTIYATINELKKSRGSLCIIGSVNSYVPIPKHSAYCSSKFAIKAIADSLYYELLPFGVSVTLICPGFVESEIRQVDNSGIYRPDKKDYMSGNRFCMKADTAARQIVKAVEKRQKEKVITLHGKISVFFQRHMPWLFRPLFKRYATKLED